MKENHSRWRGWCLAAFLVFPAFCAAASDFSYVSPMPGSSLVSPHTNIILRSVEMLDPNLVQDPSVINVVGTSSGVHHGRLLLADDAHTLLFIPFLPFQRNEQVTVDVRAGLSTARSTTLGSLTFTFTISPGTVPYPVLDRVEAGQTPRAMAPANPFGVSAPTATMDLPTITVTISDDPSPGYIFVSNFPFNTNIPNTPYLLIIDNTGAVVFARQMPQRCHDFKVQPNGLFTYYDSYRRYFVAVNSSGTEVDTFACGNGYSTDEHELRLLSNGHALLMSYDPQYIRMDTIVPGGQPNALVLGLIVQEIDANKNVVFQWRSWDHFRITDATHENLTSGYIDYVHGNAIELDTDGNILLSSRHLDEITKISRTTGNIIWRWGGRNNQFTFLNDTLGFSHQHAIRRLPNGHLMMFDNGNFHTPPFSRAVEYALDEQNRTATLVWSYADPAGTYGFAMGYAQRLENGNTLIGWGSTNPTVTEVRPNGEKAFEMTLPTGIFSYRVYRFDALITHAEQTDRFQLPGGYSLEQNYPNPFNPTTTIRFSLPHSGRVSLELYDLVGQKVSTIAAQEFSAGRHAVVWNASGIASGVYFYRLAINGKRVATRRALLLR